MLLRNDRALPNSGTEALPDLQLSNLRQRIPKGLGSTKSLRETTSGPGQMYRPPCLLQVERSQPAAGLLVQRFRLSRGYFGITRPCAAALENSPQGFPPGAEPRTHHTAARSVSSPSPRSAKIANTHSGRGRLLAMDVHGTSEGSRWQATSPSSVYSKLVCYTLAVDVWRTTH